MGRTSPGRLLWALLFAALAAPSLRAQGPDMQRGPAHNPHGELKIACGSCHTATSWTPIRAVPEFDHNKETDYPLRGMHEKVACMTCHKRLVFKQVGIQCADCHADIHRRQFGTNCEQCHTVKGWEPATKGLTEHSARFPLMGAHAATNCESCHTGAATGQFTGLSTACASCHINDFNSATSVNHRAAAFSTTCTQCHNFNTWRTTTFDHLLYTGYALTGAHATLDCVACHVGGQYKGTPADCFSCHSKDFAATNDPPHVAAGFPKDCSTCHNTTNWNNAKFDHNTTPFPLTGAHVTVACTACHINGKFAGTPTDCYSCHLNDFNSTNNPNHRTAGISTACATCHSTTDWNNAKFDHNLTKFPLTGAHTTLQCSQCHINNQFTTTPTQCSGCHMADFNKTTDPNHVAAGLPLDCSLCHTTTDWSGAKFDHSKVTAFPLTGAHLTVPCAQCHINNNFASVPTLCSGCHLADFQKAASPNHVSAGFPQDCTLCHTTTAWQPSTFDHSKTAFALTGAHLTTQCMLCHVNNNFKSLPTQCSGCHQTDFNKTDNPNHLAAGFTQDCSQCHTTTNWTGATFNHNTATKFPLTGAHVGLQCNQCHNNTPFSTTPTQCVGCHLADFKSTTNPNHVQSQIPQTCEVCHTTTAWTPASFDHSKTSFPLTGAHTSLQCSQCHTSGNFSTAPATCVGCHLADFQKTTNPNHVSGGFPQDCQVCHSTTAWSPAAFDHSKTAFPLTGAHVSLQCSQCHTSSDFSAAPTACSGCHLADFQKTTSPNHVSSGFPQDCTLCHNTTAWQPSTFDHSKGAFPLTGAHLKVACAQCHVNNNFTTVTTLCSGCHMADFKGTTDPNHVAAGLPTNCAQCHTTTNWSGATFNHNTVAAFPLTGAHTTVDCLKCHINNNYTSIPTVCSGCHMTDFKGATNPNHVSSAFPTDCTLCHTTATWLNSTFDHSKPPFALTGAHLTTPCAQCHVNNNYTTLPTVCSGCHLTDFKSTTDPNHVAANFSQDCTQCHTTTNWANATFNHNTATQFPLTGAHTSVDCLKCHINNNYTSIPTVCSGCHMTDFNGTTNPNHVNSNFPTDCTLCHNTTTWLSSTFDHSKPPFALTGAHLTTPCAQCHVNNNYTTLPTVCSGCHLTDFKGTTDPNHVAANFSQDCTQCHTTTSWANATFNHNTATPFPLTGAHTTVDCNKCHINNNYTTVPTVCSGCHMTDFNGTTNPNHVTLGFPQTCDLCHNTTTWLNSTFNHSTGPFPLTGAHLTTPCLQCHVNNNFTTLPTVCSGCHINDYNGTTNPNHAAAGFPTDCSLCHSTTDWSGATFDHSKTAFPLTGAHLTLQCNQCHINNNFTTLPTLCSGCHMADFNGTTNPNHVQSGYPTTCDLCHTTTSWAGASFNHNNTPFPLTGAHVTVACTSCHVNNVFAGTPTDCYSCHKADYNSTTNPNHAAAAFPTTCATCHTTTSWAGAVFNHTWFPIYSGTHAGKWSTCADCHTNASDYSVFSCITCHEHSEANTDPNHQGVKGYAYTPTSCYSCHPTGNGG